MTSSHQSRNKVTELHKGLGPRLFQYRNVPVIPLPFQPPPVERKRIVMKCVEKIDANSMYMKRLHERDREPTSYTCQDKSYNHAEVITTKREAQRSLTKLQSPEGPTQEGRRHSNFPPLSYLPRWNPRSRNRTYLNKMILEDPWTLSSTQRAELQKKTGLRLKSISKQYQFKVGRNLPLGPDALGGACNCYIDYCNHCKKDHERRCPLHMQWLDPIQPDCKTEVLKPCYFVNKHPEDMPLKDIKEPDVYISEVVRRLKAGEICELPNFPDELLQGSKKNKKAAPQKILAADAAAVKESCSTQTEPFTIDLESTGDQMDEYSQTLKQSRHEPVMLGVLKSIEHELPFKPFKIHEDSQIQVDTNELYGGYKVCSKRICSKLATMIIDQSFREVQEEIVLQKAKAEKVVYIQEYMDIQRRIDFTVYKQHFRFNAAVQEKMELDIHLEEEAIVDTLIGAINFSRCCVASIPARAMNSLRIRSKKGKNEYVINENVEVLQDDLNKLVKRRLLKQYYSINLLNDITTNALSYYGPDGSRHLTGTAPPNTAMEDLAGAKEEDATINDKTEAEDATAKEEVVVEVEEAKAESDQLKRLSHGTEGSYPSYGTWGDDGDLLDIDDDKPLSPPQDEPKDVNSPEEDKPPSDDFNFNDFDDFGDLPDSDPDQV